MCWTQGQQDAPGPAPHCHRGEFSSQVLDGSGFQDADTLEGPVLPWELMLQMAQKSPVCFCFSALLALQMLLLAPLPTLAPLFTPQVSQVGCSLSLCNPCHLLIPHPASFLWYHGPQRHCTLSSPHRLGFQAQEPLCLPSPLPGMPTPPSRELPARQHSSSNVTTSQSPAGQSLLCFSMLLKPLPCSHLISSLIATRYS